MERLLIVTVLLSTVAWADPPVVRSGCHSVRFETANTHRGFRLRSGSPVIQELFRSGISSVPEPILVQAAVGGAGDLGLSSEQIKRLPTLFAKTYAGVVQDAQMSKLRSVLPYCLASASPKHGHYFFYVPDNVNQDTESIVFLHGFGGNFLFYLKLLKDQFPDHIIILPSWGGTWANGNSKYIREVYEDISERFAITIGRSHLMSISGGGAISFEIYSADVAWFSDLVVFSSMPRGLAIPQLKEELKVLMINGSQDVRFPIDAVRGSAAALKRTVPEASLVELPADHVLFLSHVSQWRAAVRRSAGY